MKRLVNIVTVRVSLVIFLAVVIAFPLNCSKKEPEEIKIGCITPLSGEGATYGEATKRGIDLAVEEINNKNGINGKAVQVIYEDDQMKPLVATSAIRKLVSVDKVPAIIGAFGSSVTLAIAPIAEEQKTVLFSASSTADTLKDAGDYFFRNVPPNSNQGKSAAEFATLQLKAKSAAILHMNNDYGVSLTKAFERFFNEKGGSILVKQNYNEGDRDFRSQLSTIKSKSVDLVFYPGHYQESGLILKQAREMGIDVPFVGGDGSYSPELITIAGDAAEGSYYTLMAIGYGVADNEIQTFMESFRERYRVEPDVYSAYAYDAVKILAEAIRTGGYDSDSIKRALYRIKDFKGVTGFTSFDEFGEVDKSFYIYEVKNGMFKLLK